MASKELTNEVANFLRNMSVSSENGGSYDEHECKEKAEELLSTIHAALQDPTEGMRRAALYRSKSYLNRDIWRAMLNASPLGEQSCRAEIISADGAVWDETAPGTRNFKRREQSE